MRKKILVTVLLLCWLLTMLAVLWWYKTRYIRPFGDMTALFAGTSLQLPPAIAGPGRIRLVHMWEPACPCNSGNQQHLIELMSVYAGKVDFYHLQKPDTRGQLPAPLRSMLPLENLPGNERLPVSPAVAIFDTDGQLAYFGPYSEGATCTSSNSFIEPVLNALMRGQPVAATSTLAAGCFCNWASPAQ